MNRVRSVSFEESWHSPRLSGNLSETNHSFIRRLLCPPTPKRLYSKSALNLKP
jgi:hypothetical protein